MNTTTISGQIFLSESDPHPMKKRPNLTAIKTFCIPHLVHRVALMMLILLSNLGLLVAMKMVFTYYCPKINHQGHDPPRAIWRRSMQSFLRYFVRKTNKPTYIQTNWQQCPFPSGRLLMLMYTNKCLNQRWLIFSCSHFLIIDGLDPFLSSVVGYWSVTVISDWRSKNWLCHKVRMLQCFFHLILLFIWLWVMGLL